jgi:N-ethylmaleimide reductase
VASCDVSPGSEGVADLVAFGRPYIANPDLVQRFNENVPLAEVDWETVYASGPHGYSDYATHQPSKDTSLHSSEES